MKLCGSFSRPDGYLVYVVESVWVTTELDRQAVILEDREQLLQRCEQLEAQLKVAKNQSANVSTAVCE